MRLSLTLPELERGYSLQKGTKGRIHELTIAAHGNDPVAICPIDDHDHRKISVVRLSDKGVSPLQAGTTLELYFKPVWCKTFTVCSMTKDTLVAIICEFEHGKIFFDRSGWKEANLTTGGNGVDPVIERRSLEALGDLLAETEGRRGDILLNVISYIRKSFQ